MFGISDIFQRQQVVMTEQFAKAHTNIHFSVMHPGWVDTPSNFLFSYVHLNYNYVYSLITNPTQ